MLDKLIKERLASAGMVAKLLACHAARQGGVRQVTIVDGRLAKILNAEDGKTMTTVTSGTVNRRKIQR